MADNGQYLTPIFDHSKEQNMYHVNLLLSSTEDEQVNFNVNKLGISQTFVVHAD